MVLLFLLLFSEALKKSLGKQFPILVYSLAAEKCKKYIFQIRDQNNADKSNMSSSTSQYTSLLYFKFR